MASVQKKAKAKKKRQAEIAEVFSPEAQKKLDRKIKHQLDEMDERASDRYEHAEKILNANPDTVREAVERMVEMMGRMAGEPRFLVDGISVNVDPQILLRIQHKLHTWAAVRIIIACAKWDIRIGSFTPPKKSCAVCGRKP